MSSDIVISIRQVVPLSGHAAQLLTRADSQPRLEVIQITPPVLTTTDDGELELTDGSTIFTPIGADNSTPSCQQVLVEYSFANSYGQPYVGTYTPPSCSFNRVTWNLTVLAAGRQFDRLGTVSFGDVELFRTSTAEPTQNGIVWHYLKDMSSFLALFQHDQTLIFDLGNIINDVYTSPFNVTLTASYFTVDNSSSTPADLILPVSKHQGSVGQPSYFLFPNETASNDMYLPRNVKRAVFSVAATGQGEEEFWWSNVLQSNIDTFGSDEPLYGYSPFREIQLLIDGQLAGVAWPFPIIFTGGVVPGLWRPIVGIDAFDLREVEIDITPWLPLLCDGLSHNYTMLVSGVDDDGKGDASLSLTTGNYWYLSGKVFVWLDEEGHVTTGTGPTLDSNGPSFQLSSAVTQLANGTNDTLVYSIKAQRHLSLQSTLNLSSGPQIATWEQSLSYSNQGNFSDEAYVQLTTQSTSGWDKSSSGYARQYSYPLTVYTDQEEVADNLTLSASVTRGLDLKTYQPAVFPIGVDDFSIASNSSTRYPGAWLATTQNGSATYIANMTSNKAYSFGTTEQEMTLSGLTSSLDVDSYPGASPSGEELFYRHAKAVNGTITEDSGRALGHDDGNTSLLQQDGGEASTPADVAGTEKDSFCLSGFPGRGDGGAGLVGTLVRDLVIGNGN